MRVVCTSLAFFFLLGLSRPAFAQDAQPPPELSEAERTALARDLFEQGVRSARRAQWADAADRFSRAFALRETPQIRYNLAESLYHVGRLVEASEHATQLAQGNGEVPAAVQRSASDLAQRIDRDLGRLTIRIEGDATSATVTLDDREVPSAVLGVERPIDPGHHVVTLLHGAEVIDTEEVDVERGGRGVVTLTAPAAPEPATVQVLASPTEPVAAPAEETAGAPWWLWAGIAVLVIGAAVGAFVLFGADEDPTQGDFMPGIIEVR